MQNSKLRFKNQKEFRRETLQLHYEISKGNTWNLVSRNIVAEKLGLEDYNNEDLLGVIKYLEDKGYLKVATNVQDQITGLGVDEVENGFPNIFPEKNMQKKEEIMKLSPEIYGVGVNLKILWRKIRRYFYK